MVFEDSQPPPPRPLQPFFPHILDAECVIQGTIPLDLEILRHMNITCMFIRNHGSVLITCVDQCFALNINSTDQH